MNPRLPQFQEEMLVRINRFSTYIYLAAILSGLLVTMLFMKTSGARINEMTGPATRQAYLSEKVSIEAAGRGTPYINISNGREVISAFSGDDTLLGAFESNQAEPLSLASADFDEDGVPDLVSGYAGPSGGILTLMRGNVDSIYPNAPEAIRRRAEGTYTEAPFLSPTLVYSVPEAAEFIGAGDFDGDSHWDVVVARRSGEKLYLLSGDGRGGLRQTRQIQLSGRATAMAVADINRRDGLDDVAVGVTAEDGAKVLVFEGPEGALRAKPEVLNLPAEASSLAPGQFDDACEVDLAVATGRELMIVYGRDRKLSLDEQAQAKVPQAIISSRRFASAVKSIAVGDFTGDNSDDIAMLHADGRVRLLSSENLDDSRTDSRQSIKRWKSAVVARGLPETTSNVARVRVSSTPIDSVVVVNPQSSSMNILTVDSASYNKTSDANSDPSCCGLTATLDSDGEPVAMLPMRLDGDALSDLVILRNGSNVPAVAFTGQGFNNGSDLTAQATFSNSNQIIINDTSEASPYPSTINVSELTGVITSVTVTLTNFSHTFPRDVDILLVGPAGQKAMLMSDCGGSSTVNNVTLTFDDLAASSLDPESLTPGTFKPTDNDPGSDFFPPPAPGSPYPGSFSDFIGGEPNGAWRLFVVDDLPGDVGSISGGWSLNINTGAASPFTVRNTFDNGPGSLRQAILEANTRTGANTISFNIPGTGVKVINLLGPLPIVTEAVTIDATTQPGYAGSPVIALRRGGQGPTLKIISGNTTVRGLDICSVPNDIFSAVRVSDIEIASFGNNRIEGNLISEAGVNITSSNNVVGGTTPSASNSFAANSEAFCLTLTGQAARNNQIQGNSFVPRATCRTVDPCFLGVPISISDAPNNIIGGTTPQSRNVIAGSQIGTNIYLSMASGNLIQNNLIGIDATGTPVIKSFNGIMVFGGVSTTIGGTSPQARNVISGAFGNGIYIESNGAVFTNNLVQGNFIGTDLAGTQALGNTNGIVVSLARGTTIGGATAGARNVISGNLNNGVIIENGVQDLPASPCIPLSRVPIPLPPSTDFQVINNYIGIDSSGNRALGNGQGGFFGGGDGVLVRLGAFSHEIRGNRIAFNGGNGINIPDSSDTINGLPAFRIRIENNAIASNGSLGIDLGDDGVTQNDVGDADSGPNLRQNFPEVASANFTRPSSLTAAAGSLTVRVAGTMQSTPNTTFTVEFWYYCNSACSGSDQSIGCLPLSMGTRQLTTGPSGSVDYNFDLTFLLPDNTPTTGWVNATATNPEGNTSEFSNNCRAINGQPVVGPAITGVASSGKRLIVTGSGFVEGAQLFLNDAKQKKVTVNSSTEVVSKKAGNNVVQGINRVKVINPDGRASNEFLYTP